MVVRLIMIRAEVVVVWENKGSCLELVLVVGGGVVY